MLSRMYRVSCVRSAMGGTLSFSFIQYVYKYSVRVYVWVHPRARQCTEPDSRKVRKMPRALPSHLYNPAFALPSIGRKR
jgi:hypothetical protein